ncbi:hypothetical protein Hdeb2414_s0020g00552961 [Helianthus debilis subsp. tardiflorus]
MHKRERCVRNTNKLTGKTHCVNITAENSQKLELRPRCRTYDKNTIKPKSTYKGLIYILEILLNHPISYQIDSRSQGVDPLLICEILLNHPISYQDIHLIFLDLF